MRRRTKIMIAVIVCIVIALAISAYATYRYFFPRPVSFANQEYTVEVRALEVTANGHTLYGELLLPQEASGALPTVICSHGFGGSYISTKGAVGMSLAKSGFAVYCFDFYGGSNNGKSGGSMTEMSVFTERDDLNAVINQICTLETTDTENLFLLGESQGGFVSAITAAERPEDIRGLIEYYPALSIPDDARARHATVTDIPDTYEIMGKTVGRVYSEGLYDYDVYEVIAAYDRPVLMIHGDADKVVDVSYSQRAAEVYTDAELIVLPGQNHGFSGKGKTEAAELSYQFIVDHIKE